MKTKEIKTQDASVRIKRGRATRHRFDRTTRDRLLRHIQELRVRPVAQRTIIWSDDEWV